MASVRTNDRAVRMTADDAAVGKLSAITRGYYRDEFLKLFVRKPGRRPPLINRGYYARVAAFDKLVASFLAAKTGTGDCGSGKQIVCLGAGLDTTALRLRQAGCAPALFVELDMRDNVRVKVGALARSAPAMAMLGGADVTVDTSKGSPSLVAPGYAVLPADLRDVASVRAALDKVGVDTRKPTLFISECVLIYLQPGDSNALIQWAAKTFPSCAFAAYEQILPDDAFGRMMQKNLAARNIVLHGLTAHPTLQSQERRFLGAGFSTARAWDMNDVYYKYLPAAERRRVERLEFMDEVEEWHLLQAHYCVAVAVREGQGGVAAGADDPAAADGERDWPTADVSMGASGSGAERGAGADAGAGAGTGTGVGAGAGVEGAASGDTTRSTGSGTDGPLAAAVLLAPHANPEGTGAGARAEAVGGAGVGAGAGAGTSAHPGVRGGSPIPAPMASPWPASPAPAPAPAGFGVPDAS